MKDPTYQIRQHFINLISPVTGCPVVNYATQGITPPYVRVSVTASDASVKCSRSWNTTTQIFIVVKTGGDYGGDAMTETIANAILLKITENLPNYGATTDFAIVTQTITVNDVYDEITDSGRMFIKQLSVQNFIDQIT